MNVDLVTILPRLTSAAVGLAAAIASSTAQARQGAPTSTLAPTSSDAASGQAAGLDLPPSQLEFRHSFRADEDFASGNSLQLASAGEFRLSFEPEESKPASNPAQVEQRAAAPDDSHDLAKQIQNPIANIINVPLQFNYDTGFGPKDADRLTLNIEPVIPFSITDEWNLITRTIVPVVYQESIADGFDSDFGLGDTTQSFFFSPVKPIGGWILGAGPVALWPTGTEPLLRSESLGFGPTIVALRQDHGWTYGALANHIWSVTNSDDHDQVNATFLQPFISHTWPSATTLALNTETSYNWSTEEWTVPIHLLLKQLVKPGGQPMQLEVGGTYYAAAPDEGPEWGLRFTVTFLFPK